MDPDHVPKRRRQRPTIVCRRCRLKKAKCDKQLPCGQCVRANCSSECSYAVKTEPRASEVSDEMSCASSNFSDESSAPPPNRDPGVSVPSPNPEKQSKNVVESTQNPARFPDLHHAKLDNHFRALVARSVAFCNGSASSSLEEPTEKRSKRRKCFYVGDRPAANSSHKLNMHMRLSSLTKTSRTRSPVESADFIEPRFANAFHNFKTSSRTTYAVEQSQQDPAIKIYWEHNVNSEKLRLMTVQNLDPVHRNEALKAAGKYFGSSFITSNRLSQDLTRAQLSLYGTLLGFSLTPSFSERDSYQESLRKVLPARPVILAYLRRFFAKVYPLYPIVDEDWLFFHVDRLFNFSSMDSSFESANLASRDDVLVVVMVLFMLALSYLSCLTNVRSKNEEILETTDMAGTRLKDCPISLDVTELAQSMLSKGNSRLKSSFLLLQAHMLKMIHRVHSPDNETAYCDVDGVSSASSLLSMAVSLMLERDPSHIVNFPGDAKQRNLRRKVWYTLLQIEFTTSYLFLSPRTVAHTLYMTALPTFERESSNIRDLQLEEATIRQLRETHAIYSSGQSFLDMAIDATSSFQADFFIQELEAFEDSVQKQLGVFGDYFNKVAPGQAPEVLAIARLKVFLSLRVFSSYANYFLYLCYRYRHDQQMSFYFLKKTVLIHLNEFSYLCSELLFSQDSYFDTSFAMMISPIILIIKESSFIVCSAFNISLRCGVIMQNYIKSDSRDVYLMRHLLSKGREYQLSVQKLIKLLSERYFYAWKCVKINSYGFDLVSSEPFFMVAPGTIQKAAFDYTNNQMKDLLGCISDHRPVSVRDPSEFRVQCYQNMKSGYDANATGVDLYKTLQTDNYWIVLSTLREREYASLYLSLKKPTRGLKEPDLEGLPSGECDDGLVKSAKSLCILGPGHNKAMLEPNTLQVLDVDMLSASWQLEKADSLEPVL